MIRKTFFSAVFLLILVSGYADTGYFPLIQELSSKNDIFRQYSDDVSYARKALARGVQGTQLPLHFYQYRAKKDDTVIRIAARCSIPYDALITLNGIESVKTPVAHKLLLLPTLPALYLPEKADSDIQKLTVAFCEKIETESLVIYLPSGKNKHKKAKYRCFPNTLLDGTVRNFFFTPFYRFPLKDAVLTSAFGMRKSPFTGKKSYHKGIDLAAPKGSPVYACTGGQVIETGYSRIYGYFVIIRHTDGRESLYGHLSAISARLYQKVNSGTVIGKVGSTGLSTGPHLHFEIREHGKPKDPALFIDSKK